MSMDLVINRARLWELARATPEGRFVPMLDLLLQEMSDLLASRATRESW